MIRVLVVEDSPVLREFLAHVLNADPGIQVVGTAGDGEEALRAVERTRPDLITMDIQMPRMNGLEATRRIMETFPTPIVIVSDSSDSSEVETTFQAVKAGALAFVERPKGIGHREHEATAKELTETVKLMSEVSVVRRWRGLSTETAVPAERPTTQTICDPQTLAEIKLVAMGASTGGPQALQTILSSLPGDYSVPVLVVQHMAGGFTTGFVDWLASTSALPVQVASHGERLRAGCVHVASDGLQMKVEPGGTLSLTEDEPENGHRPSVCYLFRSVARVYGARAVGVLLTGMGKDGAAGLKQMKDEGAATIVQDEKTSVVHGMPGEAIRLEAATCSLPPNEIAAALAHLARRGKD